MKAGAPSIARPANAHAWRWLPVLAAIFATGVFAIPATSHAPAQAPRENAAARRGTAPRDAAQARRRCESCGRVQKIRQTEATSAAPASFEFTVRMYDGSLRTNSSATAGRWQVGDSIILLGGVPAPSSHPES